MTKAFAPKFTSTAILSPRPLRRNGKISDIISQPIGPKDNCNISVFSHTLGKSTAPNSVCQKLYKNREKIIDYLITPNI